MLRMLTAPRTIAPSAETVSLWDAWKADVACVFARDPAARSSWEVATIYPGVHAVLCYRLANRLWRRKHEYAARVISYLARIWTSVDIHPGATIGQRFFIDHGVGVVIGETAEIGDDVTLYHGATLGGTSWSKGKRHPTIGNGCVIGAGAKVLGPVTLGDRVKVGSNSVVVRDVPESRTAVGIPAKIVRTERAAAASPHGIDLDHHLIPDPVAAAITCLLERIRALESTRSDTENGATAPREKELCPACEAQGVCEADYSGYSRAANGGC